MGLLVNSTKHSRKKLYQFSTISFREWKQVVYFLNSFCETRFNLIPKSGKDIIRKENYRPVSLMNVNAKLWK